MPHAYIQLRQKPDMTFNDSEIQAFAEYAQTFPHNSLVLVDTYNSINGIMNSIEIGKRLKKQGHELKGIRLDSGNMLELSKTARTMLDNAGMHSSKIYVSDSLDEFLIRDLLSSGAPVDGFGVGTRLQTGANFNPWTEKGGASALGGVLKLVAIGDKPSMKFTDNPEKRTLPGKQQIWRIYDKRSMYQEDYISTWQETLSEAKPLLIPIMLQGKLVYDFPTTKEIRTYSMNELKRVKAGFKRLPTNTTVGTGTLKYPVHLSPELQQLKAMLEIKYDMEFAKPREQPLTDAEINEQVEKYMSINPDTEAQLKWEIKHKWANYK